MRKLHVAASASLAAASTAAPPIGAAAALLPRAVYVHLPFCRRRCFYCDFPIVAVGDRPGAADAAAERYCALLDRELAHSPDARPLASVYFGGGTPSLTPPRLLHKLLRQLDEKHGLAQGCEVTLEMDPGTFDRAALDAFVAAGVTRVSLGVQSFDDALLEACGRVHRVRDAHGALELLLGHEQPLSVSLDLIGGLPHQTLETWQRSLDAAARSGAHHVSVYDLQVEPRTAFGRWFAPGAAPLPTEEVAADMVRAASATLGAAGFERYEVSNYAQAHHRSQHNCAYWRNEPFLALGMGATSHVGGVRLARPRRMKGYETWVDELERGGWEARTQAALASGDAVFEEGRDALTTALMLQLRTLEGIDFEEVRARFGAELGEAAAAACAEAAAELPSAWTRLEPGRALALQDPEGFLFSNDAIATVFARLDEYSPPSKEDEVVDLPSKDVDISSKDVD
jgi:oxygen-independent coproporphyrinogen-3 oxidase